MASKEEFVAINKPTNNVEVEYNILDDKEKLQRNTNEVILEIKNELHLNIFELANHDRKSGDYLSLANIIITDFGRLKRMGVDINDVPIDKNEIENLLNNHINPHAILDAAFSLVFSLRDYLRSYGKIKNIPLNEENYVQENMEEDIFTVLNLRTMIADKFLGASVLLGRKVQISESIRLALDFFDNIILTFHSYFPIIESLEIDRKIIADDIKRLPEQYKNFYPWALIEPEESLNILKQRILDGKVTLDIKLFKKELTEVLEKIKRSQNVIPNQKKITANNKWDIELK